MPVVAPFHQRRHGKQDGFGAAVGLQAEDGAAINHQIEFDVAPAPVELEVALAFAVWCVFAFLQQRYIGRQVVVAHALLDGEAGVEIRLAQIVEEDAAHTARFVAVLEEKIFITPFFVFRMQLVTEWIK